MKGKQPSDPLKEKGRINLCLSGIARPFAEQIASQGYRFDKKEIAYCQKLFSCLLHLRMGLMMPDKPFYDMQKKITARIFKHVKSKNIVKDT